MEHFTILGPTEHDLDNGASQAAGTVLEIVHDGVQTGPKVKENPNQKGKPWTLEDPNKKAASGADLPRYLKIQSL